MLISRLDGTRRPAQVIAVAVLGLATGLLSAGSPAASVMPAPAHSLPSTSVPHPGAESKLQAVSCAGPKNCWAVGSYINAIGASLNQALHWNGKAWSLISTPDPGGSGNTSFQDLESIACISSGNCWAVGRVGSAPELTLALHWNGKKWSRIPTPHPAGIGSLARQELAGVSCTSASSCWAVGSYERDTATTRLVLNLALRWNGRKWSVVQTPDPGGTASGHVSFLVNVRCVAASNCWAVGSYTASSGARLNQALHWNGRRWSKVPTPNPGGVATADFNDLSAVSCPSPASCWAVGSYGSSGPTGTGLNEGLHWNGKKWSQKPVPDPDGVGEGAENSLNDVACIGASNCWAVGSYGSIGGGVGVLLTDAMHWNGRKWSQISTPNPGGTADGDISVLFAVRCATAASCWAVGDSAPVSQGALNQALHWNGTKWSIR